MIIVKGIGASPGIAIGTAYVLDDDEIVVKRIELPRRLLRVEVKRFKDAHRATMRDLDAAEAKVLKFLGREHAKLIHAHRLISSDILITKDVPLRILKEGVNAEFALSEAIEAVSQQFEKMDDEFFRERRHDLLDVAKRLLSHLLNKNRISILAPSADSILIARNLLPSDTLNLHGTRVLGFATDLGGKTSHTAILAQSLCIPAVVGLSDASRQVKNGDSLIIDGRSGLLIIHPGPDVLEKYRQLQEKERIEEKSLDVLRGLPAVTTDGKTIQLGVNLDSLEEIQTVSVLKPDGVGLFRTEYLFLNRPAPPNEEEQTKIYAGVLKGLDAKPVVIRTADLGGDRLAALGVSTAQNEANPFMGLRGVRLFLRYPDIFKIQLRAILRAAGKGGHARILIPMVSSLGEILSVKNLIEQSRAELKQESITVPEKIELGIMIEIPSAALMLDIFLPHLDFISIGTNDLIQYLLAVDRINEQVAHLYDSFHPAVLRFLKMIIDSAHSQGKRVGVCGEMAADLRAVPLLIALGIDELSVPMRLHLRVKQVVRALNYQSLSGIVSKALASADAETARKILSQRQP
jgi:phosphotransferase system enzyme I (PtsI)